MAYSNYPRGSFIPTQGGPPGYRPGVISFDTLTKGYQLVMGNFAPCFLVGLLAAMAPATGWVIYFFVPPLRTFELMDVVNYYEKNIGFFLIALLIAGLAQGVIFTCAAKFFTQAARTGRANLRDFLPGWRKVGRGALMGLLLHTGYLIGSQFCFFPGVAVLAAGLYTMHEIANTDCTLVEAFQRSFAKVKDQFFMAVAFGIVVYLVMCLGMMACGIGLGVTYAFGLAALAYSYLDMSHPSVTAPSMSGGQEFTPAPPPVVVAPVEVHRSSDEG